MACPYTLAGVIMEICVRAGMDPRQVDVSRLTKEVRGFALTNTYPATEAIRALAQVFFFEPANFDARVRFIPRGADTVATITETDLLDDEEDTEQERRGDPIAIPRVLNLNYFDVLGSLATDKQTSERAGDRRATGELHLQTAVVFTSVEAAQVVDINHKVMVEDAKGELKFSLPDSFLYLTPSDAIFFQREGKTERIRILREEMQDGFQQYVALRDRQSSYQSNVEGIPASPTLLPPLNIIGPTLLEVLDLPILRDVDDGLGLSLYIAVSGITNAWTGATVELSYDGGQNYTQSRDATLSMIMGELMTALGDHPQPYPDQEHSCRVRIDTYAAELEETDLRGLLNRQNLALIGDEIVQFAGADEDEPGEWILSYFVRGRKGTTPTQHPIGARFVMLGALAAIPASVTDLGRSLTFRATSFGTPVDEATVKTITYQGQSQRERAVGYLEARRDGTNAVVSWQGVGRLGGGATVAHGARFAGYRVTFSDGVAPDVVIDTQAQTITQSVAGFASPVSIRVAQLNDITGAGPATEVFLT